jgi:REP element-mobilizing transposase RayT
MARPPGTNKPHVDRDHNQYRAPLAPTNPLLEQWSRERAKGDPIVLNLEQRKLVEAAIRDLANRYRWLVHAIAPMRDHVHVVIGAPREGEQLREGIKAVASKWLNKSYGALGGPRVEVPDTCGSENISKAPWIMCKGKESFEKMTLLYERNARRRSCSAPCLRDACRSLSQCRGEYI